jgi:L-threonylcarbamoyladenylate synthase
LLTDRQIIDTGVGYPVVDGMYRAASSDDDWFTDIASPLNEGSRVIMSEPFLTIRADDRTPGGSLSIRHLDSISGNLNDLGYVLLPSDTAYSLAALAIDTQMQVRINKILNRPDWPVSLAFQSASAVRSWISPSFVVDHLLEAFCPGPITVVCEARPQIPGKFFNETINSQNRTIGVRIPDSVVEREVAGCANYPVATAAVRDPATGQAVTNFERAVEIVSGGMDAIPDAAWCAIAGPMIYSAHSTVVQVLKSGRLKLIREGFIPFADIERSVRQLPATFFRDQK